MPELPEVETVRWGLANALQGKRISRVELHRTDLRWPLPKDMASRVSGHKIVGTRRLGKFILAKLSSGETLLIHLGMTGSFNITGPQEYVDEDHTEKRSKHEHVVFRTQCKLRVAYNDPRRFGMMDLAPTSAIDSHRLLRSLGPDPLGNEHLALHFRSVLAGRKMPIKSALLDQKIVAGLGNIYACEALSLSGISPRRQVGRISEGRFYVLANAIKRVLMEAIEAGGSSLQDFRGVDGSQGYFQHDFRVYAREGEPCMVCENAIVRIIQSGRSTFYCKTCQR